MEALVKCACCEADTKKHDNNIIADSWQLQTYTSIYYARVLIPCIGYLWSTCTQADCFSINVVILCTRRKVQYAYTYKRYGALLGPHNICQVPGAGTWYRLPELLCIILKYYTRYCTSEFSTSIQLHDPWYNTRTWYQHILPPLVLSSLLLLYQVWHINTYVVV